MWLCVHLRTYQNTILVGIGLADHMLFSRYRFLVGGLVLRAQELLGRQKLITVPYKRPLRASEIETHFSVTIPMAGRAARFCEITIYHQNTNFSACGGLILPDTHQSFSSYSHIVTLKSVQIGKL